MKKNSALLIAVLMIVLTITGCGGDKKPVGTDGSVPVKDTAAQEKVNSENDNETNPGNSQGEDNMELPEEFPKDIIPILGDAQIDNIMKNDTNKAININYNTDKSLEEAVEFYKEAMKDGRNTQEINSGDSYIIIGVKGNYAVSITIMTSQGNTIVNIDTRPES